MDSAELNRILSAWLIAALVCVIVSNLAKMIYIPGAIPTTRGFAILLDQHDEKVIKTPELIDIAAMMAKANATRGKQIFKKCTSCHTLGRDEPHRIGPNLWGIVGAKKASIAGYHYSQSLKSSLGQWNYPELFDFLHNPQQAIPGTKMAFIGLDDYKDIADLIAYLSEGSANVQAP